MGYNLKTILFFFKQNSLKIRKIQITTSIDIETNEPTIVITETMNKSDGSVYENRSMTMEYNADNMNMVKTLSEIVDYESNLIKLLTARVTMYHLTGLTDISYEPIPSTISIYSGTTDVIDYLTETTNNIFKGLFDSDSDRVKITPTLVTNGDKRVVTKHDKYGRNIIMNDIGISTVAELIKLELNTVTYGFKLNVGILSDNENGMTTAFETDVKIICTTSIKSIGGIEVEPNSDMLLDDFAVKALPTKIMRGFDIDTEYIHKPYTLELVSKVTEVVDVNEPIAVLKYTMPEDFEKELEISFTSDNSDIAIRTDKTDNSTLSLYFDILSGAEMKDVNVVVDKCSSIPSMDESVDFDPMIFAVNLEAVSDEEYSDEDE